MQACSDSVRSSSISGEGPATTMLVWMARHAPRFWIPMQVVTAEPQSPPWAT